MKYFILKNIFRKLAKFLIIFYVLMTLLILFIIYDEYRTYNIPANKLVTPLLININSNNLSDKEKQFFILANPFGFVFAKHNFENYDQVKSLILELRSLFPNRKIYIALDQEGGRVDRLKSIRPKEDKKKLLKSSRYYGDLAKKDINKAKNTIYKDAKYTASILRDLGFDINFAPMLDLLHDNIDNISADDITWSASEDRSYSTSVDVTISLAKELIRAMHEEGVFAAIKHLPGIGRSFTDTHDGVVIIDSDLELLRETDFVPFKELANEVNFAMAGHAAFSKIDGKIPTTISKKVIDIIRKDIGFKGLLFSDALNMKAVAHLAYEDRVVKALEAGIDIVLPNYLSLSVASKTIRVLDQDTIIAFNKKLKKFEKNNFLLNY